MEIYRITLAKWADSLVASGRAARWNSADRFMIYTASSRALACLENVVHRTGRGLQADFRTICINVPDTLPIVTIELDSLPKNWDDYEQYGRCQQLGDTWLNARQSAILRVPSAIVPAEFNFLLNPQHSDFTQIRIDRIEPFRFDSRIK
ncbi:RES family NAD+ phosphorylase [Fibrella forsythiae]|uniref:RES family NAD+ phosphorylase n=1 Tax=Fibrella forsythiae TaxID=2817061 RepID=A0ABS3JMS9_9BACT|nr:RES family NAD+ phosphorylase [Fibrella forsythiae]MBO0951322.1 RES family NAD+ phosphorylase [Fibrella forsythiae]